MRAPTPPPGGGGGRSTTPQLDANARRKALREKKRAEEAAANKALSDAYQAQKAAEAAAKVPDEERRQVEEAQRLEEQTKGNERRKLLKAARQGDPVAMAALATIEAERRAEEERLEAIRWAEEERQRAEEEERQRQIRLQRQREEEAKAERKRQLEEQEAARRARHALEPTVEELDGWSIYMVLIFEQSETNITVLQGTVLVELGEDYLSCAEFDPSGEAANIFRDAKMEEARQDVRREVAAATAAAKKPKAAAEARAKAAARKADPELQSSLRERAEARVAQLRQDEADKADRSARWEELQVPILEEVKRWARGRRALHAVLCGLPEILPGVTLPFDVEALKATDAEANTGAVRKAYMKMLKLLHPDKVVAQPLEFQVRASGVFQVVQKAYERAQKG